ncbi:MAG: FKBP-type peptidyl-prolyl cis-trans isomerase [Ginsengibacter sp.]
MLKKFLAGLFLISFLIAGCVKSSNKCGYTNSTVIAPLAEIDSLQTLLAKDSITATLNAAGFYYKIGSGGSGTAISNLCTNVTVNYNGMLFNGKTFDSAYVSQPVSFQLGRVVTGWQLGLPLIQKGGDITLYIPPSLGYGINPVVDNNNNVIIPPNSYLVFTIHLADVQ